MKTRFDTLLTRLDAAGRDRDVQAANAIRELISQLVEDRATFAMMQIDHPDMNRIGAGVSQARIDRFLELEE